MKSSKHIADRIRLLIATRQFQVGEVLPSTRVLGKQLEASFHTVRKAYQLLAEEGLLESQQRGYIVCSPATKLDKSERLEKGATKFRLVLEELIGYGLNEEEIETLFHEQLNFMDWPERIQRCATVGPTMELAQMLSGCISKEVGVKSEPITPDSPGTLVQYDALLTPIHFYSNFLSESDEARVIPFIYSLNYELIVSLAERTGLETAVLLAREQESLPHLESQIRSAFHSALKFESFKIESRSLPSLAYKADIVLYTPGCARAVEAAIPDRKRKVITYEMNARSADLIRSELWEDA
ncbi:DNA-binding transcriptional regulator YhcF, GntR family [Cyclonatronum proteinivorum]|uniref:DNA-binding transcriptional regulator YhcF, GntR family n=1 Tax=Cyclonatronum proteinivorum TaxID=1457365 RepID=A0A345UIV8_9BACT|nr:GntR family transcriptional regulator [Cyclonatronum proteinivorum]AXJ00410.1 DNA-binding transcriptional regulator YhcF, GntR family [Cyclonatronum proteinivorum]